MTKNFFWIAIAFSIVSGSLVLILWPSNKDDIVVVKYDCGMLIGGWHPDVPGEVQDECRKK